MQHWYTPLVEVDKAEQVPLPHWMKMARPDRKNFVLTLKCGHTVKRASYNNKPLPKTCRCKKCGYLKDD